MRIACCGYVDKSSGSGSGARYLILEELLKRGHEIDFFDVESSGTASLKQTLAHPNFKFVGIEIEYFLRLLIKRYLPKRFHPTFDRNVGALIQHLFSNPRVQRLISKQITTHHQAKKYDFLLFCGRYAPFSIKGLKVISWVQGPPQTEAYYMRHLKKQILEFCGAYVYYKMRFFYFLKLRGLAHDLEHTDIFVCGSQWSKEQMIAYGLQSSCVRVLPYPVNQNLMRPDISGEDVSKDDDLKTFLWLGRIDPRKRFDLLIEAYLLLLKERQDVFLKVVGKFRFEGYKHLVDTFPYPNHLKCYPRLKHEEVPSLIKSCSLLVQPSEGENFGTSISESLCCGIPVIVGPTNGTKDYLDSHSFVFEEYTPQALKDTMLRALEALDAAPKNSTMNTHKAADSKFQVSNIVDALERIFDDALD